MINQSIGSKLEENSPRSCQCCERQYQSAHRQMRSKDALYVAEVLKLQHFSHDTNVQCTACHASQTVAVHLDAHQEDFSALRQDKMVVHVAR